MKTVAAENQPTRITRTTLSVLGLGLVCVLAGLYLWSVSMGYMPHGIDDSACQTSVTTQPGTYRDLLAQGDSPYCARSILGQTWW